MDDNTSRKKQKTDAHIFDNLEILEFKNGLTCYAIRIPDLPYFTGSMTLVSKAGTISEYGKEEAGFAHLLQHLLPMAVAKQEKSSLVPQHREADYDHTVISYDIGASDDPDAVLKLLQLIASRGVTADLKTLEVVEKILTLEYQGQQINTEWCRSDALHSFIVEAPYSGKEMLKNLENINYEKVMAFHEKWYIPKQMAVLVIGNLFLMDLLLSKAKVKASLSKPVNTIRSYEKLWSPGVDARKNKHMPNALVFNIKKRSNLREKWALDIMVNAVDRRLRQTLPGFSYIEEKGVKTFVVLASFSDVKKLVQEYFRLRKHEFTSEEMKKASSNIHDKLAQAAYVFHFDNHLQSEVLQKKCISHFLYGDTITSPYSELQQFEDEHCEVPLQGLAREYLSLLDIEKAKIYLLEPCKSWEGLIDEVSKEPLSPWQDTKNLLKFDEHWKCENLIHPTTKNLDLDELRMQEISLGNGMTVLLCQSDAPYSCSMKGFAYGGMSDSNTRSYLSTYFAMEVATRLPFGFKSPIVGAEEVKFDVDIHDYLRSFEAHCMTSDLTVALQLVYLLFCEKPKVNLDELKKVRESIYDEWKPSNFRKAYEYSSGPSAFFHKVPQRKDVNSMNPSMALEFFNKCFLDPSQFTVVIAGDFEMEETMALANKYLGSIPRESCPTFPSERSQLKTYKIFFPNGVVKRDVCCRQPFTEVFITVPLIMNKRETLSLFNDEQDEDRIPLQDEAETSLDCLRKIVQDKLTHLLCNRKKKVYYLDTSVLFDGKKYSSRGSQEAMLCVRFMYDHMNEIDWYLADRALDEIDRIVTAPSNEDIACLQSYPKRKTLLSSDVLKELVEAYQSKLYQGDLQNTILERRKMFKNMLDNPRSVAEWKQIFERLVPFGCKERCVFAAFHRSGRE